MNTEEKVGPFDHPLTSLSEFIKQMYITGGIPLVLIALGAANTFLSYDELQKVVVSFILISIGTLSWAAWVYLALVRWKIRAQHIAEQDSIVLHAICKITTEQASDVAKAKIDTLRGILGEMGMRSISELTAHKGINHDGARSAPLPIKD